MSEVLLSQLAYVEMTSPDPQTTCDWMVNVLGLEETAREGQSVYLRAWGEFLHSSLIVTEGPQAGLARTGWRAYGPDDPAKVAAIAQDAGVAVGWDEGRTGRGAAFQYRLPYGQHLQEVFWEVDLYEAPPEKVEPALHFRPQRYISRGANARYIDHVTIATPNPQGDIDFHKRLGARQTAIASPKPGVTLFSTTTCNAARNTHDMAFLPDHSGVNGRVNHIAYRVDQRLDVEHAGNVFMAHDTPVEFGPGIHGIDEITFIYAREPGGGVRMEINSGGWTNAMPDFECQLFAPHEGPNVIWRNQPFVASMMESFPLVDEAQTQADQSSFVASGLTDQAVGLER